MSKLKIDAIFHLAAKADIVPSIVNAQSYFETNVQGTFEVAQFARLNNVSRVIYAASSSCYGIPTIYPTPELAEIQPQYPYAFTKHIGEEILLHWSNVYGFKVLSLRLFNVFGPRSRTSGTYGAVFGVFLAQKLANQPFTIVGDGSQTRDFTYVTDVARAFLLSLQYEGQESTCNIGSGGTYSINYLVSLLGGEKVFVPKRPGEPDSTFADISRVNNELGWKPKVTFEEGVALILDRIQDWANAPIWNADSINVATKEWFEYLGKRN